jgi:hypothetical protein
VIGNAAQHIVHEKLTKIALSVCVPPPLSEICGFNFPAAYYQVQDTARAIITQAFGPDSELLAPSRRFKFTFAPNPTEPAPDKPSKRARLDAVEEDGLLGHPFNAKAPALGPKGLQDLPALALGDLGQPLAPPPALPEPPCPEIEEQPSFGLQERSPSPAFPSGVLSRQASPHAGADPDRLWTPLRSTEPEEDPFASFDPKPFDTEAWVLTGKGQE